jgi:Lipid A 3-O-deacylase (PagL)
MKNTLFYLSLLLAVGSLAQEKQADVLQQSLQFKTIVQGGLLAGSSGEAAALQAIHGVQWKNLYAGVGAGLDFYMQRGVPIFADFRYRFSKQRKSFFVYTDAGVHVPWIKNKEDRNILSQRTGLYTDVGIGFQLATKKADAFLFSAGYTYKHISETQEGFSWQPWPQPAGQNDLHYDYHFNRIVLKFGFMF